MTWHADAPQGAESHKVRYDIVPYTRGIVLDLGAGPVRTFPHWITVDSCKDADLFGIQIKPDIKVADCSALTDFEDAACDAVFSSHLLEHIDDYQAALAEWWRVLKVGGHLCLYLPHRDLYPNIGQPGANSDHKHDFVPMDIIEAMQDIATGGMDIVLNEVRDQDNEYSFLLVLEKRDDGLYPCSASKPKPEKTVCVSRFGAFGDMLQAANILPQLKRDGYHVTFNTTPKGYDILKHDPHIDAFLLQDDNQVPNHELPAFWLSQSKRFDKFVQLSESIEGTLLAMPGRANHMWPDRVRRVELNKNYLEWLAALAEVEYCEADSHFYSTGAEDAKARAYLADIRAARNPNLMIGETGTPVFSVMWALAGSSVHKFTPHMDAVIARCLIDMPEAVFIFSGDEACQLLEQGWELEPRVYRESGKMPIRDALTLAGMVDCVVGPETGVLNAVAFRTNAKVLFLSHSSRENLPRDWINTAVLEPVDTPCYPCHRLHYGAGFCHQDADTGAALCQANITPDRIFDALYDAYRAWKYR